MRLWAGLALMCLMVAGCQHLPEGVVVDVQNGTVAVGPCRCRLPLPDAPANEQLPVNGQAPAPDDER